MTINCYTPDCIDDPSKLPADRDTVVNCYQPHCTGSGEPAAKKGGYGGEDAASDATDFLTAASAGGTIAAAIGPEAVPAGVFWGSVAGVVIIGVKHWPW